MVLGKRAGKVYYVEVHGSLNFLSADVINALIGAGLQIQFLHEFPVCGYKRFPQMTKSSDGWWRLPDSYIQVPRLYSVKATKRA